MNQSTLVAREVNVETVLETLYDVVIVGAGVAGAIVAKELCEKGHHVLIIEAGSSKNLTLTGYQEYINTFYSAVIKDNNAPFPLNPNVPSPRSPEVRKLIPGQVDSQNGYLVQAGPLALDSSYTRVTGGTTLHWEAKTPRMLPEDFCLRSKYGQGLDWPISYEDLMPYYRKAENELGVSGDVESQRNLGTPFAPGYVYPMYTMPLSYLDQQVYKGIHGTTVELDGEVRKLEVAPFPQARNGIPNPNYYNRDNFLPPDPNNNNGPVFTPDRLTNTYPVEYGERCQGNANCTPICPVQAKYDSRKTLMKAYRTGRLDVLYQAVASRVEIDPENGRVTAIHYKRYRDEKLPEYHPESGVAKGRLFVLAANPVENARLMLASNLPSTSRLVGKNLMDHPYILTWGLMPEVTGTFRGPSCTGGISSFRQGAFRGNQAAFAVDIHNDGWGWATGSPYTDVVDIIDNKNKYGAELRQELISRLSRQLLLAFMCELPADPNNQVSIDPAYTDQLGNYRPVISFNISDYCRKTMAYARYLSRVIFQRVGAEDHTHYDPSDYGYFTYNGEGYVFRGGNHYAGTHVMGTNQYNSVVDQYQRSWDHENLYLVGAGSMPSIGSSNTTLTLVALGFRSTEQMLKDLNKLKTAVI